MFVGMPSVARVSTLAYDVATNPQHALDYLLCGDKDTTTCELLKVSVKITYIVTVLMR